MYCIGCSIAMRGRFVIDRGLVEVVLEVGVSLINTRGA
jgi:hypothetical protein